MARRTLAVLVLVLALASPAAAGALPLISVHGDSMGAQAAPNIKQRLGRQHRLHFDATERAVITDKLADIRVVGANPQLSVAVVELGAGDAYHRHGDATMRRDVRHVLDALRDVPCVRWLSLKIAGVNGFYQGYVDRADDFNRILSAEIVDYPNARVAPYRQWANGHPGAFKPDGLHHTAQGKTRYAAFLEGVVDGCP